MIHVYDRNKNRGRDEVLTQNFIMVEERPRKKIQFMSIIIDKLLVEIFLRLDNYQCVIQCSLVCKRWFSLISGSEDFNSSYNHHHSQKRQLLGPDHSTTVSQSSLPYTLLLRTITQPLKSQDLFPKKSTILHGQRWNNTKSSPLDFLNGLDIKSSFDDLLLVQRRLSKRKQNYSEPKRFYICNPLTKQWVALPEAPEQGLIRNYRCGLVCDPNSRCVKYRVVRINFNPRTRLMHTSIFSSETRQWNESSFSFPFLYWRGAPVACNGIIYWPLGRNKLEEILALDPFDEAEASACRRRCRSIRLPAVGLISPKHEDVHRNACLGVVRGRLRLSQSTEHNKDKIGYLSLKAWELNLSHGDDHDAWLLVHDVAVKMLDESSMYLIGLHPDDGDVFFFLRNHDKEENGVYEYHVGRNSYEKVQDTPHDWATSNVFTLVHPWLPTKIPV